jgi:hypothetical protein
MMNANQINVFKELLADPGFKGKKALEHLLWLNTSEPKFKPMQIVTIKSKGIIARVVEAKAYKTANEWFYTLEVIKDDEIVRDVYALESDLK